MLGLIDGNSFYCSCERAFNPALRRRAVVVLSNNDGCVIARSNEARDLGLKMGEPWHLVLDKPQYREVVWMSSNYALYGDMSRRMFEVLHELVPAVEPYSIDEMFLDFKSLKGNLSVLSSAVRAAVRRIARYRLVSVSARPRRSPNSPTRSRSTTAMVPAYATLPHRMCAKKLTGRFRLPRCGGWDRLPRQS